MPPVPEDKIYQVWVIEDDVPKPSGLFEPGQEDPVAAVVEHSVESDDAVAVTVESRGGFAQADQRSHAGGQSLNYSKVSTTRRVIDQDTCSCIVNPKGETGIRVLPLLRKTVV